MNTLIETASSNMFLRSRKMSKGVDLTDMTWKVNDFAMIPIKLKNSTKLDVKYNGPFKVKRVVGPKAIELELPKSLKIHPVFNVEKLKKVPIAIKPIISDFDNFSLFSIQESNDNKLLP